MKKILLLVCLLSTFAHAKDLSDKKELLSDIKEQTKKCSVQLIASAPANGNDNVVGFKSVCKTLVIVSQTEAQLLIDDEWIIATLRDSKESDGGDLDDLIIKNNKGKILAIKTNIPAYGSVIVAMAGNSTFANQEAYTSSPE